MKELSKGWSGILPYLLIGLVGIAAFSPTLRGGFLWDDHVMIEGNSFIQKISLTNIRHAFTHDVFEGNGNAYFRPFQILSNMADYQIWKLRPFGYHLTNLLFHLLNAGLLFFLLKRIASTTLSLWTSVFFVIHPVVIEQLLIIAGRAEIMSMTFILLSVVFYGRKDTLGLVLAIFSILAACFFKESGVVAPLLIFLFGWSSSRYRLRLIDFLLFVGVIFVYLFLRKTVSTELLIHREQIWPFLFKEFPSIFTSYIGLLLFPTDLHSHHRMVFHGGWKILSSSFVILILLWGLLKKRPLFWFGLAWFVLGLLPKMPLLATNSLMLDHWAYLGSPGFHLILASLIVGLKESWTVLKIGLITSLLLFWGGMDWWNWRHRNTDEKNYLWALKYPSSSVVRYNLGLLYYQQGNYPLAQSLFENSLQINPMSPLTMNALALSRWHQGQKSEALIILSHAIQENPHFTASYYNRALIERGKAGLMDLERALAENSAYEKAVELQNILKNEMKGHP